MIENLTRYCGDSRGNVEVLSNVEHDMYLTYDAWILVRVVVYSSV